MSSPWIVPTRKTLPKGRMTKSQRAFFLIGAAVMQQVALGIQDPDTRRSATDVVNWVEFWLSKKDLRFLEWMGFLINPDEAELEAEWDEVAGFKAPDLDDDIPF